jgi:hypothetical protein
MAAALQVRAEQAALDGTPPEALSRIASAANAARERVAEIAQAARRRKAPARAKHVDLASIIGGTP